jgi:hypothetical protein
VKRPTKKDKRAKGTGGSVRGNILLREGEQKFAVLKFPRQRPLVLSVKVVWKKVKLSEVEKVA